MANDNIMLTNEDYKYLNNAIAQLYYDIVIRKIGEQVIKNFLESLKSVIKFEKGEIYFCNYQQDSITYDDFIFCGWTKEELDRYHQKEIYKIDEVLPIVSNPSPMIFRSSDVFIQSERKKTKYYNDVVHPLGMDYSVEGNITFEDNKLSAISIHRSENNTDFTDKDLEVIRYIRPHLINISKIYKNSEHKTISTYKNIPFDFDYPNLSFCSFDQDFNLISSNINYIIENTGCKEKDIIITIINAIKSNILSLDEHKKNNTIDILINKKKYITEIHCTDNGYDVLLYNLTVSLTTLLNEVKQKYNLSDREYDVFLCLTEGLDTAEIADKLFITVGTAKKHLINIYKKLNIKGKHQVLSIILQNNR